jgi:hypothetical protein
MRYAKVDKKTGKIAELLDEGAPQPKEDQQFRVVQVGDDAQVGQTPDQSQAAPGHGSEPREPGGQGGQPPQR